MNTNEFKKIIWDFYRENKRDFPWRQTNNPYKILVSELMLQQTQVDRVIGYYDTFLERFPAIEVLAKASLSDVLRAWQGLGYNRRAKFLHTLAKEVTEKYNGKFPDSKETLMALPGVGQSTAGAVIAFAYNKPSVFIETNIRRVFIHFFFSNKQGVPDKDIRHLVEETVSRENPREWYYALMDYGSTLTKVTANPNRKSKHYAKQSKFKGSPREVRGAIIRALSEHPLLTYKELAKLLPDNPHDSQHILQTLEREGFIQRKGIRYTLA